MKKCNDQIEDTCGKKMNSRCVEYEGDLNESSVLKNGCTTIHATTEELYKQVETIQNSTELSQLGNNCINYSNAVGEPLKVNEALVSFESEICKIKSSIPDKTDPMYCPPVFEEDLTCVGLDMKCLVDPCGQPITTLKVLLQELINKTCECCS